MSWARLSFRVGEGAVRPGVVPQYSYSHTLPYPQRAAKDMEFELQLLQGLSGLEAGTVSAVTQLLLHPPSSANKSLLCC